jgi:hypothetical protein
MFLSWVALCHGNRGIDYFTFGEKEKENSKIVND